MSSSENDLINSCLVCRDNNKNLDFECLYESDNSLSETGQLYEELFGIQIRSFDLYYYPQFLCKSCELQMKLFKKLILKALETFEALKNEVQVTYESHHNNEDEDGKEYTEKHKDTIDFDIVERLEYENKSFDEYGNSDIETIDENEVNSLESYSKEGESQQHDKGSERNILESAPETHSDVEIEIELVQFSESKVQESSDSMYLENADIDELSIAELNFVQSREKAPDRRKRTFKCHACEIEFSTRSDHTMHRKKIHSNKFPCSECPKLFSTSDALSVHAKLHNNSPAFKCELCSKTFNQKVHFEYHMNKHNNVRQFKCELCEKSFISRADLNIHFRSHTDERRYTCEFCGKRFLLMQHLKMHRYSHDEEKSITCSICNQKFVSPSTLNMHIQTIHSSPQFECEMCDRKFRRKHHLLAHHKVHERAKNKQIKSEANYLQMACELNLDPPFDEFEDLIEVE